MLEAAIHLLGDRGFAGTSVDAVADRAGVSKATIYRHWSSKEALCGEAVACVVVEEPPRGGDPRRELTALLTGLSEALEGSDAGRLLPHLASAAATDHQLAEIWRQSLVDPTHRRVTRVLHRAVQVGQLDPASNVDLAAEMLLGPLFYRRLMTGAPVDEPGFAESLVAAVWGLWQPHGPRD